MSEATIQIAYDGPALASGIMDVRELAPTLLGFADLYEHANKILNGDDAYVNVSVQSDFKRGSFEISFQVLQNLAAQASVFAGPDGLISTNELVTIIAYGVFRLVRR